MQTLSHVLDRMEVVFDDTNAVASAGLCLPLSLADHLGLRKLFDDNVDLRDAPGHANVGAKAMGLIASALAGGDCIDDADMLRAGRTPAVTGAWMPAPSTLGTFLRSFTWGDVRSLDKVASLLLALAWGAGAGPGDAPFTIDIDSTILAVYGTKKQGARFGYTKCRCYHPLVATAAGTGDVLGMRVRGGHSNTARGAKSFVVEVINRVRAAGATGPITLRADSGFYSKAVVDTCRALDVAYSLTVRMSKSMHALIEDIKHDAWVPIPYWLEGGADVAEVAYRPFGRTKGPESRLIVRRVKPSPGSQLSLLTVAGHAG